MKSQLPHLLGCPGMQFQHTWRSEIYLICPFPHAWAHRRPWLAITVDRRESMQSIPPREQGNFSCMAFSHRWLWHRWESNALQLDLQRFDHKRLHQVCMTLKLCIYLNKGLGNKSYRSKVSLFNLPLVQNDCGCKRYSWSWRCETSSFLDSSLTLCFLVQQKWLHENMPWFGIRLFHLYSVSLCGSLHAEGFKWLGQIEQ